MERTLALVMGLLKEGGTVTITSRDVESAVELAFLGEARQYCLAGYTKVAMYNAVDPTHSKEERAAGLREEVGLRIGGYSDVRLSLLAPVYLGGVLEKLAETGEPPPRNYKTEDRLLLAAGIAARYLRHKWINPSDLAAAVRLLYPGKDVAFTAEDLASKMPRQEHALLNAKANYPLRAAMKACLARAVSAVES